MNLAEENKQPDSRQSVFGFSCPSVQWSQVTPQYMPWGHSPTSPPAPLVTFNAQAQAEQPDTSLVTHARHMQNMSFGHKSLRHCKRKANLDIPVPTKQHITEEKMAAHMSRLHISSETHPESLPQGSIEDSVSRHKRLYVCEEMRRLQTESILPTALLGRLERPCMAVMLWQPPAKVPELLGPPNTALQALVVQSRGAGLRPRQEEDENENNATTADLNNMEMDS